MIFSPHKDFIIAVYLFEPDPELHSGTERLSFSDKFRRPCMEHLGLSVNLARLCFLSITDIECLEKNQHKAT